jgi:peptide/nickel transport system substrate-binding protein
MIMPHDVSSRTEFFRNGLPRRDVLRALGLGAAAAGLGLPALAQETPRRGGLLRVATYTQSTNDTCDPAKFVLAGDYLRARCFYNALTWLDTAGDATPDLAESFGAADDSQKLWRFKLRRGVTFHDGSSLTAEDVRFSILRHKTVASAARQLAANIVDVRIESPDTIMIELVSPDVDFPLLIGTYHFSIIKDGTTDFTLPNGTGPFKVKEFKPGLRTSGTRFGNYWREGLPYVDAFELITILDAEARVNALLSGDVHLVNELRGTAIEHVANSGTAKLLVTPTRRITSLQYRVDMQPSGNQDLRLALAHLIDRKRYVDNVLKGQGVIGNDHPFMPGTPYYNADIPQRELDRDKAKFHFTRSGIGSTPVEVNVSEASPFSLEIAQLLQREGSRIGLNLDIRRNPSDSYWNNVSGQRAVTANTMNPRPTDGMNLNLSWRSGAPWNRTRLNNAELDSLIDQAGAEADQAKRKQIYGRVQEIIHESAVMTIPAFMNYVDGMAANVRGLKPLPVGLLGGYDFANTVWLAA